MERWRLVNGLALCASLALPWAFPHGDPLLGLAFSVVGIISLIWDCCAEWRVIAMTIALTAAILVYSTLALGRQFRPKQPIGRLLSLVLLATASAGFFVLATEPEAHRAERFPAVGFWLLGVGLISSIALELTEFWVTSQVATQSPHDGGRGSGAA
jgi:hypothetical protein